MNDEMIQTATTNFNIEMDAKEFGEHVQNGGWKLGLLVARSVSSGTGGPRTASNDAVKKISLRQFAEMAKIGDHKVKRYLESWERAAEAGDVPSSAELVPGQSLFNGMPIHDTEVHTPSAWKTFFSPPTPEVTVDPTILAAAKSLLIRVVKDASKADDSKDDMLSTDLSVFVQGIRTDTYTVEGENSYTNVSTFSAQLLAFAEKLFQQVRDTNPGA